MESVGVRELKAKASEIVEKVRATGARVQITRRGQPVAVLSPASNRFQERSAEDLEYDLAVWTTMDELAEEIGRRWPPRVSAVDELANSRR